jgi:hypothetical protein
LVFVYFVCFVVQLNGYGSADALLAVAVALFGPAFDMAIHSGTTGADRGAAVKSATFTRALQLSVGRDTNALQSRPSMTPVMNDRSACTSNRAARPAPDARSRLVMADAFAAAASGRLGAPVRLGCDPQQTKTNKAIGTK